MKPILSQIDLVARDPEATIAFYRALGVEIPESAIWRTASGIHHVDCPMPDGMTLHFDSFALAKVYDRGWQPGAGGTRNVITFHVGARAAVDEIHNRLAKLGHKSAQSPWDAFWGARYAIVEDPDGNHVGLMSDVDDARKSPPPDL